MLALGQVIVGVRDLDAAAERFRALGFDVLDGGVHPNVGTANRIIPLGDEYLELLGVVNHARAVEHEYGRALLRATADGDRLVRWSIRTDAIDDVAHRLGLHIEARSRVRPDGETLTWRAAGLDVALADSATPFFMQWDRPDQFPGALPAAHANGARRVSALVVEPRDPARLRTWTAGAAVTLRVVGDGSPGLVGVAIETAGGELLVRG